MWLPCLDGRAGPRYRAITEALAEDVAAGRLPEGERLPTHRDLANRLRVTVGTVSRAYSEAARLGLIGGEVGRGTFVRPRGEMPGADAECLPALSRAPVPSPGVGWFAERAARAEGDVLSGEGIDLSLNYPLPSPIGPALAAGLQGMQDEDLLAAIGRYQPANGLLRHREAGVAWLRSLGVEEDVDDVLVVPGCQGGLTIVFQALCGPGDVVLHEALTWPGLHATAASLGVRTIGLAIDADGLMPDAFDAACREHRPRLLYTMPTLHNPTAIVMPEERRHAVAAVARRHGVVVVEDDVYGFLLDTPPPAVRTLLPELGIYVTSISKSVAPGLRIGWLAAPSGLVPRLAAAMRRSILMTSSVAAEVATRTIFAGAAGRAAEMQREEARRRQELAAARLAGLDFRSHPRAFHGWLRVPPPWRRDDFVAALRVRGVIVTPGTAFGESGGRGEAETHVRLCLCAVADRERLAAALDIVAETASGGSPSRLPDV